MKTAVLAGISLKGEGAAFEDRMAECESLCEAAGFEAAARVTQKSDSVDPRTAFRSGKLQELALCVEQLGAEAVIFDRELSIAVMNRIQEAVGVEVIDRTNLILDIFSLRARSKQARMQVELARLLYALPSFAADHEAFEHERGGSFRTRGSGESRSAQIVRAGRRRIAELRRQLAAMEKEYHAAERRRGKSELARAALVGYTNAGKSSLLNAILADNRNEERSVFVRDMLFATLDSSVRNVSCEGRQFLLYDTVGFVSDLPHTLVEAFHSTLESARNADLLIHVADMTDSRLEEKMQVTKDTLRAIGADDIPLLTVYTKADRVKRADRPAGLAVSSLTGEGIPELLDAIARRLYPHEEVIHCLLPYEKTGLMHELARTVHITVLEEREEGYLIRAEGERVRLKPLQQYEVKNENSLAEL